MSRMDTFGHLGQKEMLTSVNFLKISINLNKSISMC